MKYTKEELLNFIKTAYATIKLAPCAGEFVNDDETGCCPITALHCLKHFKNRRFWFQAAGALNTVARELDVPHEWVIDFYEGFDYRLREKDSEGFKYGKYIRKHLFASNA